MKYWRGYLVAAILGFFTWALMAFANTHTKLIDMVYPYITRMIQTYLAQWTGSIDILLWQVALMFFAFILLALVVMMVIFKWNPIQLFGWVLAVVALVAFLQTGVFGLNSYAGPIADDIRLTVTTYNQSDLEKAAVYYRDHANALARQIARNDKDKPDFPEFEELAQQAGEGFRVLTYEKGMSIFAGDTTPVKELGWSDYYISVGITGIHLGLTGEAAVNPQTPVVGLPFTMCHEMAHRMCIANEQDANFAAFLACAANPSPEFQYSAYFMAFRYCCNSLAEESPAAAKRVMEGADPLLKQDMADYDAFFAFKRSEKATEFSDKVYDLYLKLTGTEEGLESYANVTDLLVSWHVQEVVIPQLQQEEENKFDPYAVPKDQDKAGEGTNG